MELKLPLNNEYINTSDTAVYEQDNSYEIMAKKYFSDESSCKCDLFIPLKNPELDQ